MAQGIVRGERVARQQYLHRYRVGQLTGHARCATSGGHDRPLHLGQAERCMSGGHAQVGAEHQLAPTADREAVDGRDDRLVELDTLQHSAGEQARVGEHAAIPLVGRLTRAGIELHDAAQVGAGAERDVARAGDDHGTHIIVGRELGPRVGEATERFRVQRVALLGPVDAHQRDVAVTFDHDRGHGRLFRFISRSARRT